MAKYKAKVTFDADTKSLIKGVSKVDRSIAKLGKNLERHSQKFLGAGLAMGGALAGLATQGIAYGTTIDRMSKMTGVAAEEMSRLAYSAELYHGDAAKVEKGVRRLAKAMSDSNDGLETYTRAFDKAGITVTDTEGNLRAVNDVLLDMADYMASGANETEIMAVAQDLLGGRQSELIPWLKQGSAAIREQFAEADQLGLTLSGTTAEGLEAAGTAIKKMKLASRGLGASLATLLSPAIESIAGGLVGFSARLMLVSDSMKGASLKAVGLTAAWLVGLGTLGRLAPVLGAATAPLAGLATLTALVAGELILLDGAAKGAVEQISKVGDEAVEAQVKQAAMWIGLQAGAVAAIAATTGVRLFTDSVKEGKGVWQGPVLDEFEIQLALVAQRAERAAAVINEKLNVAMVETSTAAERMDAYLSTMTHSLGNTRGSIDETQRSLVLWSESAENAAAGVRGVTSAVTASGVEIALYSENLNGILEASRDSFALWAEFNAEAIAGLVGRTRAMWGEFAEDEGKFMNTLKKATAMFLRDTLQMFITNVAQRLLAAKIAEIAIALMAGQLNWGALAAIPGILAAYGAATAALSGIKSFDVGAKVQRGGAFTGMLHAGERIVNLADFKSLVMAADGGGRGGVGVTVNVQMYGVQPGTMNADNEFRRLGDIVRRQIGRP